VSAQNKSKKTGAKLSCRAPKVCAVSSGANPAATDAQAKAKTADITQAKETAEGDAKTATKRRRRRRGGKRVAMGEALRREGLDERMVAETYAGVVATLKSKTDEDGVQKLLVDILKECTRHLDPSRPTDRSGTGDTPVTVQLIHAVPRPERPPALPSRGPAQSGTPESKSCGARALRSSEEFL